MSKAISALGGALYSEGLAKIEEAALTGMITLRGDLNDSSFQGAIAQSTGLNIPDTGMANFDGSAGLCWMSPDELLFLCEYKDVAAKQSNLQTNLKDMHSLVVDVSDTRALFNVTGQNARIVMSKLAPVDFTKGNFEPGQFRRSRLSQVAAAFWMPTADRFSVICFRSNAKYVFDLLQVAAQPGSGIDNDYPIA